MTIRLLSSSLSVLLGCALTSCNGLTGKGKDVDSDSIKPAIVKYLVSGYNQSNNTDIYYIGDATNQDSITLYSYPMRDDTIHASGADKMMGDGLNFAGNVVRAKLSKDKEGHYIIESINNVDARFTHTLANIIGTWKTETNKQGKGKEGANELTLYGDGHAKGAYVSWEFAEPPANAHTQLVILHTNDEDAEDDTLTINLDELTMGKYKKVK